MLRKIKNVDDVKLFAKQLVNEGVNFHCDEDFSNYINSETNRKTYSKQKANFRNRLMNESFQICEKNNADIYEIMGNVLFKELFLSR